MENKENISDDFFEFMLRRSLNEFVEQESLQQEQEFAEMGDIEDIAFSETYQKEIEKLLGKKKRKVEFAKGKIACAAIIILISTTSIGYNVNADLRFFVNQIFNIQETQIDITQSVTNVAYDFSDIPDSWEYFYVPEYLPVGYKVDRIQSTKQSIAIMYSNTVESIVFTQEKLASDISLDIERADWDEVDIGRKQGYLTNEDDYKTLVWMDEQSVYRLESGIKENELIQIAESITVVNK